MALRGAPDAGVWTSTDGLSWQRLPVSGDIPSEGATGAALLPGGVPLSDRRTTWFGEAHMGTSAPAPRHDQGGYGERTEHHLGCLLGRL